MPQNSQKDADLTHSILEGKGKFMLPMKDKLGAKDVDQMVAYVRAFRGGQQVVKLEPKKPIIPLSTQQPAIVPGKQALPQQLTTTAPSAAVAEKIRIASGLYRQYCLICHGADGRGLELKGSMPEIPDLTSRAWQAEQTNSQLAVSILEGKGTLMPAFRGRVNEDDAQSLVAYVRAFAPQQRIAVGEPGSDFESRFRQLEQQWDELQRQLSELPPLRKQ
jgi:mono/diheme cytochrome c family protein